jgi:hypothetical protein
MASDDAEYDLDAMIAMLDEVNESNLQNVAAEVDPLQGMRSSGLMIFSRD